MNWLQKLHLKTVKNKISKARFEKNEEKYLKAIDKCKETLLIINKDVIIEDDGVELTNDDILALDGKKALELFELIVNDLEETYVSVNK